MVVLIPEVAPLGAMNNAKHLQWHRSQKTNPNFILAEVILFWRFYGYLNMGTRTRSRWDTFDRRWQQEHNDDDTDAIHHRTKKMLMNHASKVAESPESL